MEHSRKPSGEYRLPVVIVYPSLGMVYPPRQCWRDLYDADVGLERGTIFRELDKPWYGDKFKMGDHTI